MASIIGQSLLDPFVFTQGDTAVLSLTATDGYGNPINLTGASFSTSIHGANGVVTVFPNSQHTIVSAVAGQFSLSLSSSDTLNCGIGINKDILTSITIASTVIVYRGTGALTVLPSVPLQ